MSLSLRVLRPSLASRVRRGKPVLVVLHATAGSTLLGALQTLRDRGLSYHFLIDRDGSVIQAVDPKRVALHAGSSYGPLEAAAGVSRRQDKDGFFEAGCSVNPCSIGISFVNRNDGKDPYTAAQATACTALIERLKVQFPSLVHLSTHALVSPGRKNDPLGFDAAGMARQAGLRFWPRQ